MLGEGAMIELGCWRWDVGGGSDDRVGLLEKGVGGGRDGADH